MKKILFSILIVVGLFIVACGKNNESEKISAGNNDKSRPKLEIQDVEVIELDGEKRIVKQIVITPADEIEQDKLFEAALQSNEKFLETFSDLDNEQIENALNMLNYQIEIKSLAIANTKNMINLENSFNYFIKNDKELRKYISDDEIQKIEENLKRLAFGNADTKIETLNKYLRYPEEMTKRLQ